jgi:hypothetical protein
MMHRTWILLALVPAGCTISDGPATRPSARQRQDSALRDPMNYKVDLEQHDISGGPINNLDKRGLKRDVDTVLNP